MSPRMKTCSEAIPPDDDATGYRSFAFNLGLRTGQLHRAINALTMRRFKRHWAHSLHVPYWWLRCLFWRNADDNALVKTYHRLLVWDLMRNPWLMRALDRLLNPLIGKSVVMYYEKRA